MTPLPMDGSIHALGSGGICAYSRGADLVQVFGPPYSAPELGSLSLDPRIGEELISQREALTAIWTHSLPSGELTDFAASKPDVLLRRIRARASLVFILRLNPSARAVYAPGDSFLTVEVPAGTFFYAQYPYPRPVFYRLGWEGAARVSRLDDGAFRIECQPGESQLYFCGGPELPQAVEALAAARAQVWTALLAQTRSAWLNYSSARASLQARLPADLPLRSDLLQAADDVAVLIRAQQSAEGGVLAGHNYHLCYVRDQYGVSRGLIALGHASEAQAILEFYWQVWQRHGRICNAQAAGIDGVFHIHENDEVEITGYLIRQAFDLERAGCQGVVERVSPMLAWAWEAQVKHLLGGMLPFNGDETYVAGGILPRTTLNDGSAEATLLFLDGGEKWIEWAASRQFWPAGRITAERELLAQVRASYRPNFWRDGGLLTNNPARAAIPGAQPRFRHGVCERCHAEGRMRAIGWTERSRNGRYLCQACLAENDYTPFAPAAFQLQSVSLTPLYFNSNLFAPGELRPAVETIFASYQQSGRLPSRPEDDSGISVGYDYGFLLFALTQLDHPGALDLYRKTLSLRDTSGAWVEYYRNHHPQGTRCRPWESGINIEALLNFALHPTRI